jgi:hypothetical protein
MIRVDALLRCDSSDDSPAALHSSLRDLFICIFAFGFLYGVAMGTYGGLSGERLLQMLYSGLKVPLLLLASFALSLPSFWVLNALLGLAADFPRALRALLTAQAALTLVLVGLTPFTLFWYVSFSDYHIAILFNAAMFAVASFSAQMVLRRYYRPLIARQPRHRWLMRLWLVIYAFVGIQMGWILRPFLGDPGLPVQFFRTDSWGNAYVVVAKMAWQAVSQH